MEIYKVYVLPEHTELMYEYIKADTVFMFDYITHKNCTVFYTSYKYGSDVFERYKLNIPFMTVASAIPEAITAYAKGYGLTKDYNFQVDIIIKKSQIPYWLKTQHKRYQTYKLLKLIGH